MAEQVNVPAPAPAKVKAKKKGGCLRGCLIFLLAIVLLAGLIAVTVFDVPRKLGWVKGPGDKLVGSTSERYTAEQIVAEAEAKGFKSEGVMVFVFPKQDSDEAVLLALYDFSGPAALSEYQTYHPVVGTLLLLGGGEKSAEYKITHVGARFHDEEGRPIMNVAASTVDIRALQAGTITEEEFRSRLGKDVDLLNYFQRAVIPF